MQVQIPEYPTSAPISLEMQDELHPKLALLPYGISEFTFAGLYLFRKTYGYRVSQLPDGHAWITGSKDGMNFGMLPCGIPEDHELALELLESVDFLKGLARPLAEEAGDRLIESGYSVIADRDNFDYLYLREDLAELKGRKFHKKRNHVNAFLNNYNYEERVLTPENTPDAVSVNELWRDHHANDEDTDYEASREALELWQRLELKGYLVYVEGAPAAFTLGESLRRGRSFVVHFEKALEEYRGLYQFVNKAFASILPRHYVHINREQDLGDEGLRQSKMTYRPCGFVEKFRVVRSEEGSAGAFHDYKNDDQRAQESA